MECDNCENIGCIRCMKKSYGKWICHKCKEPEKKYYYEVKEEKKEVSNAFNAMFG
jgi:hypothetical protein